MAPEGGTEIWAGEDQFLPTDSDGLWTAQVGAIVGLTDAVFSDTVRWLDINVSGTQLPRVRLVTGPYAHRVSTVDGASGGSITSKVTIGPGHTTSGTHAFVAGEGSVASGNYATVSGGQYDTADGEYATVGGGRRNRAGSIYATVAGGSGNRAMDFNSSIGGGIANYAGHVGATIAGGAANTADGIYSFIGGGHHNHADGDFATIAGGGGSFPSDSNVANGRCAAVPGGTTNWANGNYSLAAGRRSQALHSGTFVWGDSTDADFSSSAANQFLIRASGGVGIGTNAPDGPLHVQNGSAGAVTGSSNAAAVFEGNGDTWLHILSPDAMMRGILFGSPANSLMGSIRFNPIGEEKGYQMRGRNNNILVEIDSLGNLNARGNITATGTCCASDERLKRNIQSLPGGLDKVTCLRGVTYEWKPDESGERIFPTGQQIGLIAQEVQKVVPAAVTESEDGYLAVDYTRLVTLLIEGMKEQQRQIDELKALLEAMRP